MLVSQRLTRDNYNPWIQSMNIAQSVKNKTGFIDGTLTKPNIYDPNYNVWMRAIIKLSFLGYLILYPKKYLYVSCLLEVH